jgi:hypothetical protein
MMEIQSLSVCVPAGCPNRCPFCVSRQHQETYDDAVYDEKYGADYERQLTQRMQFARDNHCNTVILTGSGEPVTNPRFLLRFAKINSEINTPFQWIEVQTSGVTLMSDKSHLHLLRGMGVSTISLSVANIFNSESNAEIMGTPEKHWFNVSDLCREIKALGFNLRLSLNMSDIYNNISADMIFTAAQVMGADQITFRYLYENGEDTEQAEWVRQHPYRPERSLEHYVVSHGRQLETLPFGATRYSVRGISTVLDSDCMSVKPNGVIRYLILRENGKLYTKWDDKGSLLF